MSDAPDQKSSDDAAPAGKSKKKLLVPVAVLAVVLLGFAYMTMGKSKAVASEGAEGEKAHSAEPEVVPGEVVTLSPVTLNLADGAYLKVGLALQLVEGAHGPDVAHGGDGAVATWAAPAYDAAIEVFGGHTAVELIDPASRRQVKKHLKKEIAERYHDEVMGLYFTEFVTQ